MPSPYWESQTAPLYGATRTLGAGIAQLPLMRAMAANRAAMAGYYTQRGNQAEETAQEAAARTQQIQQQISDTDNQTQEQKDFADSAANAVPVFSDPNAQPGDRQSAATDLMRKAGRLAAKDPEKAMQIFNGLVQRMQASPTDQVQQFEANNPGKLVTQSDVLNDPQLAAAQAAKIQQETRPAANQLSTHMITIKHPLVAPTDAVPGAKHWFGPNEPETPATPGSPEWTEQVKVPDTAGTGTGAPPTSIASMLATDPRYSGVAKQLGLLPPTPAPATSTATDAAMAALPDSGTPAPQTATAQAAPQAPTPQPQHVAYLLQHPEAAPFFDQKFGPGSAALVLKNAQTPQAAPATAQ